MLKTMEIKAVDGTIFPGLLSESGVLTDSRTGGKAFGDSWKEITLAEYDTLCDIWGLEG